MFRTGRIANGTTVTVSHLQGSEQAVIVSGCNALPGELFRYAVRFADGTVMDVSEAQVSAA